MLTKVKKRDGSIVDFNEGKIIDAIFSAAKAVGGKDKNRSVELTKLVVKKLEEKYSDDHLPTIEGIQDIVEEVLIKHGHAKTAKAYILYRHSHSDLRQMSSMLGNFDLMEGYLNQLDWRVKENANMTYSLQGMNFHISSQLVAKYWLNRLYPTKIANAHSLGDFHVHDLGTLAAYCVGWDLQDLLTVGFKGVGGKVSSRPAKHLRTALGQIVNFFYTLQGEAAGAQAFSNFDTYLAPFIRADKMEYKEVRQAMQEFIYNTNVPTRVGFQTPFTNITMDLRPPKFLANNPVIIGGKTMDTTYGEYQEEMDMINQAFAEVMIEGDADGRPFTFPIPTYNITKDFVWDDKRDDIIWEMTGKYGIPYFANFVNSDMQPDDVRSMCCRLRIDNRVLRKRGGGLFGANPLTGSIGVVTINMPKIGYLSKSEDRYFEKLGYLMDLAKESLELKRKVIESFTDKGLYPYSKFYLRDVKKAGGSYWNNHFSTIGLIGMNESLINFMDKDITTTEGHAFAIKVMDYMRDKLTDYQEETGNIWNLEATPGEGTAYRLARIDKKNYPGIKVANEKNYKQNDAKPYYTNSTLPPVGWKKDLFGVLNNQDPLQKRYTGGTVFHAFLGEKIDGEAAKAVVRKVFEKYELPYMSITPTFSICPKHGYITGEHFYCPVCDNELEKSDQVPLEVEI